jgi:hypothetical protein
MTPDEGCRYEHEQGGKAQGEEAVRVAEDRV